MSWAGEGLLLVLLGVWGVGGGVARDTTLAVASLAFGNRICLMTLCGEENGKISKCRITAAVLLAFLILQIIRHAEVIF